MIENFNMPVRSFKYLDFERYPVFSEIIDRHFIFEISFSKFLKLSIFMSNIQEKSKLGMKSDFSTRNRPGFFFVNKNCRIMYSPISGSETWKS